MKREEEICLEMENELVGLLNIIPNVKTMLFQYGLRKMIKMQMVICKG